MDDAVEVEMTGDVRKEFGSTFMMMINDDKSVAEIYIKIKCYVIR